VSRGQGSIFRIVCRLDERFGSFFISRLILTTGVKLRTFEAHTPDDPAVVAKVVQALCALVPPEELRDLLPLLPVT